MGLLDARFSKIEDSADYRSSALGPLRVLDFSRVLAGPFATMLLGDLGAEVTKVERPGVGDDTRAWGPPYDDRGEATYFQAVNRNKSSLALDFGDPTDLAELRRLALEADVLVENFRPGLMARHGLDYESLAADNGGLVYCSVTGFGRGGGAALPGYDLLIQALGGLMSITGQPDGEPTKVGVALVDVLAGLFAAVGILAALRHREATGEGQLVEVDLFSALLASLVNQGSAFTIAGVVPTRMGNRHPSIAPYELFPTADGDLVLAVGGDRQFEQLCEAIGAPELAADPCFATNPARVENREKLTTRLRAGLATKSAGEWAAELTERRVPAGVVNDIGGAFALAERIGLEPTVRIPRGDGGGVELTRNPIKLSATPVNYAAPPPALPELADRNSSGGAGRGE
ncbi:MAG TPA: CoA transferase [Solirubrobacterales bacterium]|nr:CoA transferase [Solirubrobacterales bacterium]